MDIIDIVKCSGWYQKNWEHPYYENMAPVVVTSNIDCHDKLVIASVSWDIQDSDYHTEPRRIIVYERSNNHISDHGFDQPLVFGTSSVGASLLWKYGACCCYKHDTTKLVSYLL